MKGKNTITKRLASIALCLAMVLSLGLPTGAAFYTSAEAEEAPVETAAPIQEDAPINEAPTQEEPSAPAEAPANETTPAQESAPVSTEAPAQTEAPANTVAPEESPAKEDESDPKEEAPEMEAAVLEAADSTGAAAVVIKGVLPKGATAGIGPGELPEQLKAQLEGKNALAYDVSIFDAAGNKIEPTGPVAVTLQIPAASLNGAAVESVTVLHVKGGGSEAIDTQAKAALVGDRVEASFETDSFSVFVITWPKADGEEQKPAASHAELYEKLMQAASLEEMLPLIEGLSEEEEAALAAALTDEQLTALQAHVRELAAAEEQEPPQTVVFTQAGPFLPAVTVETARRAVRRTAAAVLQRVDNEGLLTEKTATANDDGSYTVRIESYATGTVTTETKSTPVDIVLVLDQSGSMAYDFNGNSSWWMQEQDRRQYAMKQAVNNFVDQVNAKYDAEDSDHRMAIVTFGSNAATLQGWTYVNDAGKTTLQSSINGLPAQPSGATNVGAGMVQAESLMGSGYAYNGKNTERQKVVIVFTDGVPTKSSDFDVGVANTAISSAKNLKDSGVTVYTIGIFAGANPNELYGASGFDYNSNGAVGSRWGEDNWGLFPGTDFAKADRPAGNRFLNYLSSNSSSASAIGLQRDTDGLGILHSKITYTITGNAALDKSGYYLTASDAGSLNTIFQQISQQIQTSSVTLDGEAVLKDIVTPYFTAPDGAKISVKTAEKTQNGWNDPVDAGLTATVSGKEISVTGFDYSAEFVSDTAKTDGSYGKKLIVEFEVWPETGFLGGNDVPTNEAVSGIYDKDETVVEEFERPVVNVPIKDVTITAPDYNVYLLGGLSAETLNGGVTATVNGTTKLDLNKANYGLQSWQYAYVNISHSITADGEPISDMEGLTEDGSYTAALTVEPKTDGKAAQSTNGGTPAAAQTVSANGEINVFKPELTYQDSTVCYGDPAPKLDGHKTGERWIHKDGETITASTDTGVTMTGEKPTLDITYTTDPADAIRNGKIAVQTDIPVKAEVKIGEEDVTAHTTFVHTPCDPACTWNDPGENGSPAFLIHVKVCQLTITKTVDSINGKMGTDATFQFKIEGNNGLTYYRMLNFQSGKENTKSVTIVGLPSGSYTVTELESAGYTMVSGGGTYRLDKDQSKASTSFTNTATDGPFGDSSSVKNTLKYEEGSGWVVTAEGGPSHS